MGLNKRALYFTVDALLAAMLIVGGILLITRMTVTKPPTEQIDFLSKDLLVALDHIPITAINHSFVSLELENKNITNKDNSVLEQITEYWALGENAKAQSLSTIVLEQIVPPSFGVRLTLDPDIIYEKNHTGNTSVVAARRMISGIEKGKPVEGSSSYGYLSRITDKKTSSYGYFGGFVGQGNITLALEEIPSDVNSSSVISIILEADAKREFDLFINDMYCTNLTPSVGNLSSDVWDITFCNDSIVSGINNITIDFNSLNNAYIGGGFVRVDFETDTFQSNVSFDHFQYNFPDITGIVNLYDSFYVPGDLNALQIYLHYYANHSNATNPFYLTIGNVTIYTDVNSTDYTSLSFSNAYLSALLNYTLFSNSTIPLRVGFENLTYSTEYIGDADVVLITDVSGSMDWNFTHDYSWGSPKRNCDDAQINALSTQRLSVAKCLDKEFSSGILNVSGNRVGLVSYDSSTDSTLGLTKDLYTIYEEIGNGTPTTGYSSGGGTCICCGINSAASMLSTSISTVTIISQQDDWLYDNQSLGSVPQNDSNGRAWYDPDYVDDGSWPVGQAVLGHDGGVGGVAVDTEIGNVLFGASNIADLWDLGVDDATPEVDFTSGLNSSANTYGIGAAHDGWDWASGVFGYGGSFTFYGAYNGEILMRSSKSSDSSGAYAVSVNITQEQYDTIVSNGSAVVSFIYGWDDYRNYFERRDQVWIKGQWTSPYSGSHLLGSDKDVGHRHGDSSYEIDARDNPDLDIYREFFSQDISSWIEGPGLYYLELGGKLDRSSSNEWGYFYFDDILLFMTNTTDSYFFRKHFNVTDLSTVAKGVLNVLSDDVVTVYLNGNLLIDDGASYNGTYWDIAGYNVPGSYFRTGDNVLAAKLSNVAGSARFDLELLGVNDSKNHAMLVMTDGDANYECSQQGWTPDLDGDGQADRASDDAIQAACDAASNYGITIYAVGYGQNANEATLGGIANCGNGLFRKSQNSSELSIFYQDVVLNILEVSKKSQSILVTSGTPSESRLFGDSYVLANYSSVIDTPAPNEIELVFQTPQFDSCTPNISIQNGLRVSEALVTSYSGEHWSSLLRIDNKTVFNMSQYTANYSRLGDPYIIHLPAHLLTSGMHTLELYTADNNLNTTGCSSNNSLIYTAYVNSSTSRSYGTQFAEGCFWTVEFEDGQNQTFSMPQSYAGAKTCFYTNSSIVYDTEDAYDVAVHSLLSQLDFDLDGRVLINLGDKDLEIIVSLVSKVPYLWGPALVEVQMWQ